MRKLTLLLIFVFVASYTYALNITSLHDNMVVESVPDNNYGQNDQMRLEEKLNEDRIIYYGFDFTGISDIVSANLSIYCYDDPIASSFKNVSFYFCNDTFDEDTLTWNNQATEVTDCYTERFAFKKASQFNALTRYEFAITDEINNNEKNFTIKLVTTPTTGLLSRVDFWSGDTPADTIRHPVITYSLGDITPPVITYVNPTDINTTIPRNYTYINITANDILNDCDLNFNGSSYDMANNTASNFYYNVTNLVVGNYTFNVTCNDTYSNIGYSYSAWVYSDINLIPKFTFNFYDEETETLLNGINVYVQNLASGVNYTTNTGTLNFTNLPTGNNQINYYASGYNQRSYSFNVVLNGSIQKDLYLLNATNSDYSIIKLVDQDSKPIESARLDIYKDFPPHNIVNSVNTNFEGETTSDFRRNTIYYKFYVYYNDALIYTSDNTLIFQDTLNIQVAINEDQLESLRIYNLVVSSLEFDNNSCTYTYSGLNIKGAKLLLYETVLSSNDILIATNTSSNNYDTLTLSYSATPGVTYICEGWVDTNTTSSFFPDIVKQYSNKSGFAVFGFFGFLLTFIIVAVFATMKSGDPRALIISALVGLIVATFIGFINIGYIYIAPLIAVGALIAFMIK